MPDRLEAARQTLRQVPADDADARAMALLRLGLAASDAQRLGEARDAFTGLRRLLAQNVALTPAIQEGLERLVEVLVLSERLDEAFDVARTLPDNEGLLAAIALSRGDYAGAEQLACAAASRILGTPIKDCMRLADVSQQDVRTEILDGQAPAMRRLLLLWGTAALGQEKALVTRHCDNCMHSLGNKMPACAAAFHIVSWVTGGMLREGAPDTAMARRDLGLTAFLRGDSLLRAGYLTTVKSSLVYALFELDGPSGAEGWAMRARVALAALAAAQGRPLEALAQLRTASVTIEDTVGRESIPWIEAAALTSEVATRLGRMDQAVTAARAGLAAGQHLPPRHSLVLRLKRTLCQGLLGQGKTDEAGRVAMNALGLSRIPAVDNERLRSVFKKLFAIPEAPPSRPIVPTNRAELQRLVEQHRRNRQAQGKVTRAKHDILAAASGLPAIPGNMPVAARYERILFDSVLLRLIPKVKDPREQNGARLVRLAMDMDEYRAEARLEGSGVQTGLAYSDSLRDVTRGTYPLDETPLRPGTSPFLGLKIAGMPLLYSALDWLSLASMFPGEKRESLMPGEATDGLEHLLGAVHRLYLSPEASEKNVEIYEALVHAQAASRGEVLGTLLTRAVLVGDPAMPEEYRHDSQQAIDGELWLRRARSRLLDIAAKNDPVTPRISRARALARRLALAQAYWGSVVGNKFFSHVYADRQGGMKGFESLTWFGSAKYEFEIQKPQARLGPDEAMVVWLPLEGGTHVFVIKKDACLWRIIPQGQAALGGRIRTIRGSVDTFLAALRDAGADPLAKPFPQADAHDLYQALFGAIEDSLTGVTHLYTVQLGVVGGIPLGLLVTRPGSGDREPAWLADRFAITRVPGLFNYDVLARKRTTAPRPAHPLLAAGDPVTGPQPVPVQPVIASIRSVSMLDGRLPRLRETRQEIEDVAGLLGLSAQDQRQYVLSGPAATPRGVLDRLARTRFKYLLFATHGLVGKEDIDVGEPALVLSPESGRRSAGDDGLLRASDIVGLDLDTDLVLLSACETSPSGEDGAEPLAGLASAFLVAGAHAVLSTQWPVVSQAAKAISVDVISGLGQGADQPARVLQRAVKRLRASHTSDHLERHPGYWAPFECIAFPR
jgi:CHAT domain-containing protein